METNDYSRETVTPKRQDSWNKHHFVSDSFVWQFPVLPLLLCGPGIIMQDRSGFIPASMTASLSASSLATPQRPYFMRAAYPQE